LKARSFILAMMLVPTMASAQRSETSGFRLNVHANGSAIKVEDSDDIENGGGLGVSLGWGFSPSLMLYATLDAANINGASGSPDYGLGHFDLGMRYSFAGTEKAWVPFLLAGLGARAAVWDNYDSGEDLSISGAGVTFGGGLSYYFSPSLALEGGLKWNVGKFTQASLGGETVDLDEFEFSATSTRFNLGLSWQPRGGSTSAAQTR